MHTKGKYDTDTFDKFTKRYVYLSFDREKASRISTRPGNTGGDVEPKSVVKRLTDSSRPEAIQKFQNFVARRGQTDGWNSGLNR